MVTNEQPNNQPRDPSASLLLTSVRRQSFAKIIGVHFVTIHQPLWVCIEVWLQCPKEAHFIARNAQSKKAEGNLYVQTPTELEERDDLEEKLSSPSSSAAATCSWIRLRGQKHEMRGAGGRWRHSPSHDSFQPYPIINDLRRIFSIKPEIFRWKRYRERTFSYLLIMQYPPPLHSTIQQKRKGSQLQVMEPNYLLEKDFRIRWYQP